MDAPPPRRRRAPTNASANEASRQQPRVPSKPDAIQSGARKRSLAAQLLEPVESNGLLWFRRAFALAMVHDAIVMHSRSELRDFFDAPGRLHFSYPWPLPSVRPIVGMAHLPWLLGVSACTFGSGAAPRLGLACFTVVYAYLQLADAARYVNHYYLYTALGLLLTLAAIDGDGARLTRRLYLLLLRAQFSIVYLFGGLAKCNAEFVLRREPLRGFVRDAVDGAGRLAALRGWLDAEPFIAAAAVFAIAFDLVAGLAFWRRAWRTTAMVAAAAFHGTNALLFTTIGSFPFVAFAASALFTEESSVFTPAAPAAARRTGKPSAAASSGGVGKWRRGATLGFGCLWVSMQALLPLRHHLMSDDVSWTRLGNDFAWRMMADTSE